MKQWFYGQNDEQVGPVPEDDLVRLLRTGSLGPETLVWTEGQADWVKAMAVEALRFSESAQPPTIHALQEPRTAAHASPTPGIVDAWSKRDLLDVAKYQRYIQWAVLVYLVAMSIPFGTMVVAAVGAYCVYRLARALRAANAWLYVILLFIPLVGLLTLVHFVVKATRVLRANGIGVGVMGAKMSDFQKIP